jgi:hypothetical protein
LNRYRHFPNDPALISPVEPILLAGQHAVTGEFPYLFIACSDSHTI